ncbi:MAG: hypothetical protein AAF219_09100 [Myxococcota bacterium]
MKLNLKIGLLVACCLSWVPTPGAACDEPRRDIAFLITPTIPAGGALIFELFCSFSCAEPTEVSVVIRDSANEEVSGAFVEWLTSDGDNQWAVWAPDSPFTPGDYRAEALPIGFIPAADFHVTSELIPPLAQVEVESELLVVPSDAGQRFCCDEGPIDSCGAPLCFSTELENRARLTLNPSSRTNGWARQLLYRVSWRTNETGLAATDWRPSAKLVHFFAEQSDAYCFRVEIRQPGNPEVFEKNEQCVSHGELPSLGFRDTPIDRIEAVLNRCDVPPSDFSLTSETSTDEAGCTTAGAQTSLLGWLLLGFLAFRRCHQRLA